MFTETLIDKSPVWLLFLATIILLGVGCELGFRLGCSIGKNRPEVENSHASTMMGSALGLLAFILAFTFGMSSTRFDARKQLVLEEAVVVLNAYQRAQLLPEPQRSECSRLLKAYVDLRVQIPKLTSMEDIDKAVVQSEEIQDALWQQVGRIDKSPVAVVSGFTNALSELGKLQMHRVRAAVWNRIPSAIVLTLYGVAILALTAMGYSAGISASRATIPAVVLILAFSAIMILIIDLERPRQEFFEVSQEPMVDVSRRIESP